MRARFFIVEGHMVSASRGGWFFRPRVEEEYGGVLPCEWQNSRRVWLQTVILTIIIIYCFLVNHLLHILTHSCYPFYTCGH